MVWVHALSGTITHYQALSGHYQALSSTIRHDTLHGSASPGPSQPKSQPKHDSLRTSLPLVQLRDARHFRGATLDERRASRGRRAERGVAHPLCRVAASCMQS